MWPYEFGLVYSVTLTKDALRTSLQVTNEGKENFEFQVLMHTYLNVEVNVPSLLLLPIAFPTHTSTGHLQYSN